MARPKADISPTTLEQLGRINATLEEVGQFFGTTERTIRNRLKTDSDLRAAWDKGRATGRVSLRRKQVELAMTRNAMMLVWLWKQLHVQREQSADGKSDGPMPVVDRPLTHSALQI